MKIYPFQATIPEFKLISSSDSFFKSIKNQFMRYRDSGFYKKAARDAIYVHQIEKNGKLKTGIVATLDISNFKNNKVLKHENTIAAKQQLMTQLLLERNAMIKPILLAYESRKSISKFIDQILKKQKVKYEGTFDESQEVHRFYEISDGDDIQKLTSLFKKEVGTSYIADGHHRCATIQHLYDSEQFRKGAGNRQSLLCTLFPFQDLEIHDFNRVVDVFDQMTPTSFIAQLSNYCKIKPLQKPTKPLDKFDLTMYFNEEWYRIRWRKKVKEEYLIRKVALDADILNDIVMTKILKIEDIRASAKIKYIEGVKGIEGFTNTVDNDRKRVGFCVYPVSMEEIKIVAENNLNLPPKSTWFEPRIKNGLIVEEF